MAFALYFTPEAHEQHEALKKDQSKIAVESQVRKCLGYLELNPRHPSLRTHKFTSLENPFNPKEPVFEAYHLVLGEGLRIAINTESWLTLLLKKPLSYTTMRLRK